MLRWVPAIEVQLLTLNTSIYRAFLRYFKATLGFLVLTYKMGILLVIASQVIESDSCQLHQHTIRLLGNTLLDYDFLCLFQVVNGLVKVSCIKIRGTLGDKFEAGLVEVKDEFFEFGLVLVLNGFFGLGVDGVFVMGEIHF
jgi:hypothetical protein